MKTLICIGTHPDDIEIGCAGSEKILLKKGFSATHVVVTDDGEGSLKTPQKELIKTRKNEAIASAKVLGVDDVRFLNQPDGLPHYSLELRKDLIRIIREVKPEIVFTHSSCDNSADHLVVHALSMSAIQMAGGPWYRDCGAQPHSVSKVFGYEVWSPISRPQFFQCIDSSIDTKVRALEKHQSQISDVGYVDAVLGLAKYRGALSMSGEFAEAFEILKISSAF